MKNINKRSHSLKRIQFKRKKRKLIN